MRFARWARGAGLVLLLVAFFGPLPSWAVLAAFVPGVVLFLVGAIAWLARDIEPWTRRGT